MPDKYIYLIFTALVLIALAVDVLLLSKKNKVVTTRVALTETVFWVALSLGFCAFIWYEHGRTDAIQYLSAYVLEWSLSIDNIFVFIIIFLFFKVRAENQARVLLLGISNYNRCLYKRFNIFFYV